MLLCECERERVRDSGPGGDSVACDVFATPTTMPAAVLEAPGPTQAASQDLSMSGPSGASSASAASCAAVPATWMGDDASSEGGASQRQQQQQQQSRQSQAKRRRMIDYDHGDENGEGSVPAAAPMSASPSSLASSGSSLALFKETVLFGDGDGDGGGPALAPGPGPAAMPALTSTLQCAGCARLVITCGCCRARLLAVAPADVRRGALAACSRCGFVEVLHGGDRARLGLGSAAATELSREQVRRLQRGRNERLFRQSLKKTFQRVGARLAADEAARRTCLETELRFARCRRTLLDLGDAEASLRDAAPPQAGGECDGQALSRAHVRHLRLLCKGAAVEATLTQLEKMLQVEQHIGPSLRNSTSLLHRVVATRFHGVCDGASESEQLDSSADELLTEEEARSRSDYWDRGPRQGPLSLRLVKRRAMQRLDGMLGDVREKREYALDLLMQMQKQLLPIYRRQMDETDSTDDDAYDVHCKVKLWRLAFIHTWRALDF